MLKIVESIEKFIIRALIIMMLVAILLGTIELGRVLILEVLAPPLFLLDVPRLFDGFGLVLIILIGIELLKDTTLNHITAVVLPLAQARRFFDGGFVY